MSWPDDNRPRFIVTTLTGYSASAGGVSNPTAYAYVLDRAYCHRVVAAYRKQHGGASWRIRLAEQLARKLNAAEAAEDAADG
jgi:hypothetical protein